MFVVSFVIVLMSSVASFVCPVSVLLVKPFMNCMGALQEQHSGDVPVGLGAGWIVRGLVPSPSPHAAHHLSGSVCMEHTFFFRTAPALGKR